MRVGKKKNDLVIFFLQNTKVHRNSRSRGEGKNKEMARGDNQLLIPHVRSLEGTSPL